MSDFSYAQVLGNNSLGNLDPTAKTYIASLTSNGVTLSGAQKKAISNFYKTGKSEGWYTQVKRMYLPIWSIAAANAVDMITNVSGTFAGGVTHATGYVQGNGTTGYFDLGVSPQGVGMVAGSSSTFALVQQSQATFNALITTTPTSNKGQGFVRGTNTMGYYAGLNAGVNASDTAATGIYIESETATNSRYFRRRNTSGVTSLNTNTTTPTGSYATYNINAMCGQSAGGSRYGFSTARLGSYGVGLAMSTTQADQFTAALKILWETCSGLVLP